MSWAEHTFNESHWRGMLSQMARRHPCDALTASVLLQHFDDARAEWAIAVLTDEGMMVVHAQPDCTRTMARAGIAKVMGTPCVVEGIVLFPLSTMLYDWHDWECNTCGRKLRANRGPGVET